MISRVLRLVPALVLALLPTAIAVAETPSGLPLPRFVTTRSTPINVRVGPGTKYDVSWIYKVAGTPVEIIQEFDVWRKIRDVDGSVGWVHQNMLSGNRAGYVLPEANVERVGLRTAASDESGVAAWVGPGYPVKIQSCEEGWCAVSAVDHPEGRVGATFTGYLPEGDLWGVYRGETFD
jgi:SH3-like domain-containing protein